MTDREVIIVDPAAQARKQYADEMKELAKHPPDRSIPGGYFLNADGSGAHDANGKPVELRGEDKKAAAEIKSLAEARAESLAEAAEATDSAEEMAALDRQAVAAAPRRPAAVEPGTILSDGSVAQEPTGGKAAKAEAKAARKGTRR